MKAKIVPFNTELGHAIRNVLFVFEFAQPVAPHAMAAFRPGTDLHESLKKMLPKFGEQQQFVVNFSNDNSFVHQTLPNPSTISGVTFERFKEDGEPALGLNVQGNILSVVCGAYTRWEEVVSKVNAIIEIMAGWLREYASFANFTLQYLDEFKVYFDSREFLPLTELFSSDSPYIVSNFKNVNRDFHSHHGFFSDPDFEIAGRLLTNINVNAVNVGGSLNVQIQTTHKYEAAAHLTFEHGLKGLIGRAYEYLHQENKKIVGSMLTPEVKEMISFDARRREA